MTFRSSRPPKYRLKRVKLNDLIDNVLAKNEVEHPQKKPNESSSNESLTFNQNLINQSTFSNSDSDNSSLFGGADSKNDKSDNAIAQQQPQLKQADLVNIVFTWNYGGNIAFLIGTFSAWKDRIPMKKNQNEFTLQMTLERGLVHQYKFIVDEQWRFAPDQLTMRDASGNINNFIDTTHFAPLQNSAYPDYSKQAQAENSQSNQKQEGPERKRSYIDKIERQSSYGQNLPILSDLNQEAPIMPIHFQYNYLSRDSIPLHNEQYSKLSLNKNKTDFFEDHLDLPSHVVINHINTWRDQKEEMTVLSITQRLSKTKFATIMYYKPCIEEELLFD